MPNIIINTDGGSRGNPGPAAVGYVINGRGYGEPIGHNTNNVAEYTAVIKALKKAKQLVTTKVAKNSEVELRTDSELLAKQLNGEYKIKDENLQPLFIEIWNLKTDFKKVTIKHVYREDNKEADSFVNKALDNLL